MAIIFGLIYVTLFVIAFVPSFISLTTLLFWLMFESSKILLTPRKRSATIKRVVAYKKQRDEDLLGETIEA